ncbi:hypothetical protein [Actinoplanes sp. NPDC049265]|uniref:hypothetical protein n=1 Tax=Actinoplanes sp. NPDC049265 TaxID=3363902 RepID=UPI0037147209
MIVRIGAWLGWIVAALLLTPVWLDNSGYEGFRPEGGDIWLTATVFAVVAGLMLGFAYRAWRLVWVLALTAVSAAVHLGAVVLVYRYLIPVELSGGLPTVLVVVLPVVGAALGFGAGTLVRRPAGWASGGRWWVVVLLVAIGGVYAVTGFVRVGAEWATERFLPADASTATTLDLAAGRHAVYATYNDQPSPCVITDSRGGRVEVRQPTVEFTDNSDSVVTVLFGVFDLPRAERVRVDCPRTQIGSPPDVRGPLGRAIFWPIAVLVAIGALPGLLLAAGSLARRTKDTAAAGRRGR